MLHLGFSDEELPKGELTGGRRNIAWTEAHESAILKWGSEAAFQEQVLKKLFRGIKKVESIFPEEAQSRRKRLYKNLRLGEKYAMMEDVLVKNKSTPTYLSYFQPQLIGEHYISGKVLFNIILILTICNIQTSVKARAIGMGAGCHDLHTFSLY